MKKSLTLIALTETGLWTACQQVSEYDVNSRAMTSLSIKATTLTDSFLYYSREEFIRYFRCSEGCKRQQGYLLYL